MDETDEVKNPPINERFTIKTKLNPKSGRQNITFKCKFCPFSTPKKVIIANHLRIHWNEKPYKCEVCGQRFSQQGNRSRH